MKFAFCLISRGAYIWRGRIFGGKFVLVIRGLMFGGLIFGGAYIRDLMVFKFLNFYSNLHSIGKNFSSDDLFCSVKVKVSLDKV